MDDINIDGHKLTQHPIEVGRWLQANDAWEGVKTIYPIYVEVSPFGGCNYRCTFCAKDFLKYKPTKIAPEVLKEALSTMVSKGVKSVMFAGEGEPMLYDELGEILAHCKDIGLDTALTTNCSIDNKDILRSAALNSKWMRASVNAGTAKEHSEIHKCRESTFEQVFDNLRYAVGIRNQHGSTCVIGAQAVLLEPNKSSMIDLARRCRETGVDYLVIKPYSQHPESLTHVHENTRYNDTAELAAELAKEQSERFKVYFRTAAFEKSKETSLKYSRCHSVPVFWAYIRSNGDVSGCNAFLTDKKFRYGNINEQSFSQIWEGPERQTAFEFMRDKHDISRCRINCRMDKVNEYLSTLKNPVSHVNFI
jgi:radical SAM protein with 4Fe4S-binding SPASM domain